MKIVQLGKTDLLVSRICFGCWQLSPRFWGDVPQDEWEQAVVGALDSGVNFIDTADAYGDGYAESQLGEVLSKHKLRDKYIIATKFYWNFEREERHPDTRYEYILRACEASLKRLQTDHIDLYQIHAWDALMRPAEVAAAFGQLKKQGKVRWFGVSNFNSDQMRALLKYYDIECLQPNYSLLARDAEAHELPLCLEERLGMIAYSPLYRGLLTGKYERGHQFNDSRANSKLFQGAALNRMLDAMDELKPLQEKYELSMAQLAIAWILAHPATTSAIVGVKKLEHITTIVDAADRTIEQADWHRIANIIDTAKTEANKL